MLKQIIGVTLNGALDSDIVWTQTTDGYMASCDAEKKPLLVHLDELPPAAQRDDHSLFTFVSSDGIDPSWINTYQLSRPWRRSTVDAMRMAGYRWYAHLVVPFAESPPTLVLFGRGESAFGSTELTKIYDHEIYEATIRKTLRSDLQLSVAVENGTAQLEAQLLEPGGALCTRTGVTVYWESTGGYFLSTRTQSIDGKATAVLKDFTQPCVVKAGFRHFPAKAELTL
jgi:hypothetical protein